MKPTATLLAAGLAALFAGCSSSGEKQTVEVQETSESGQSLARTMAQSGRFEVLSSALMGAGVATELDSDGPYTIFLVSDDSLEAAEVESLAARGGLADLEGLALFHVVPGIYSAEDLADEPTLSTLSGQRLRLSNWNGLVEVQSWGAETYGFQPARVVEADLFCDNGVMHVIDRPLVPSFESLADHLSQAGVFQQLLQAARAAGVLESLAGDQPLTFFAPTDEAFGKLEEGAVEKLKRNPEALALLLQQHVVPGRVYADTLHHETLRTVAGTEIDVRWSRGRAFIGATEVVATDFEATNGVMHVIDSVLGSN